LDDWLLKRGDFAASLVSMPLAGLSDLNLDDIMMNFETEKFAHIDFGCSFSC
jgi:hypothetical protein